MPKRLTHAELREQGVYQLLEQDQACEECGVQLWDYVCRYCRSRICRSCARTHGCTEMWVDERARREPPTILVEIDSE